MLCEYLDKFFSSSAGDNWFGNIFRVFFSQFACVFCKKICVSTFFAILR